ncbi:hypothetical protein EV202_12769 [Bacteroides heparinolyticus]|uniref:Uncharacterized protein n=1 Tax=Prevotella heparinolytica TaxID=28113 RepID=A0A4R2LG50_9BACE|nr:hypothetical protein EV202_12769 [Bacteroides heparinolyticus]
MRINLFISRVYPLLFKKGRTKVGQKKYQIINHTFSHSKNV